MAGIVSGLHVFAPDVGPEPLSLLDGNFGPLATAMNTLSNFSNNYVDSGAVNSIVVTVPAPQVFAAYTDGVILQVKIAATNTIAGVVVNVNALGAKSIVNPDGSALAIGQLPAGGWAILQYDAASGKFMLIGGGAPGVVSVGKFGDGSAANPSITFDSDLTVGLYKAGPDILGFASSSTARLALLANGDLGYGASQGVASIGAFVPTIQLNGGSTSRTGGLRGRSSDTSLDWIVYGDAGAGALNVGTVSNHPLTVLTNNVAKLQLTGAGDIGYGVSNQNVASLGANIPTIQLNGGTTTRTGGLRFRSSDASVDAAMYVDTGGAGVTLGSATNHQVSLLQNNITRFAITTTPALQGWGPVSGALVDMTPDTGTATVTYTGMTATVTGTLTWTRSGKLVTVTLPAVTGTSNATTFTITGIPAAIQPATLTQVLYAGIHAENNAVFVNTAELVVTAASGTWTMLNNAVNNGWTAAGAKGFGGGSPIPFSYLLN